MSIKFNLKFVFHTPLINLNILELELKLGVEYNEMGIKEIMDYINNSINLGRKYKHIYVRSRFYPLN